MESQLKMSWRAHSKSETKRGREKLITFFDNFAIRTITPKREAHFTIHNRFQLIRTISVQLPSIAQASKFAAICPDLRVSSEFEHRMQANQFN